MHASNLCSSPSSSPLCVTDDPGWRYCDHGSIETFTPPVELCPEFIHTPARDRIARLIGDLRYPPMVWSQERVNRYRQDLADLLSDMDHAIKMWE